MGRGTDCLISDSHSNVFTGSHLVAAFLLCDSISCFRHNIPSMASGSDSAPVRLGSVADGSRRDEASPLSLPGPFTDSDSEPCGSTAATRTEGEAVEESGKKDEEKPKRCGRTDRVSSQAANHSRR